MKKTREVHRIDVEEIAVDVFKKRVKSLRLSVHPPAGRVRISAPLRTSDKLIRDFVTSKLEWLRKQQRLCEQRFQAPLKYVHGEPHWIWGRARHLEIVESSGQAKVSHSLDCLTLCTRPGTTPADRQKLLTRYYRQQILAVVPELLSRWEPIIGVRAAKITVRPMTSRWGSCSVRTGNIRLSSELAKRSPELLEYVLVHELVHLLEASHNARFYTLMDRFLPSWKTWRQMLKRSSLP
jgi:predicted metal-dependent hydrolase